MRSFLAKIVVTAGVGIAALAVPATAFASTAPGAPVPTPTVTVTPDNHHQGDNNWNNKGDDNKGNKGRDDNRDDKCRPELRVFTQDFQQGNDNWNNDSRDNSWNDNQGRNDWRLPCVTHQQPRCVRCVVQNVTFAIRHLGTTFTKFSGPALYNGEHLKYLGHDWYLKNVSFNHFQVSRTWGGPTAVNYGPSIRWGIAQTVCPRTIHHPVSWNTRH